MIHKYMPSCCFVIYNFVTISLVFQYFFPVLSVNTTIASSPFLSVPQDDNLMDVLQLLVAVMSEQPGSMVQAFDQRNGIR